MKLFGHRSFTLTFLGALALSPITALLWQVQWGWISANWVLYPIVLFFLAGALITGRRIKRIPLIGFGVFLFYGIYFAWSGGDLESLLRLFVSVTPLFFVGEIREQISPKVFNLFWRTYLIAILIPISACILQLLGYLPYYDSGMAYDLYPGRISGGYLKPNNLNAILFPVFLFGFYLMIRGDQWKGVALSGFVFLIVLVGGLRTSVIAYGLVFVLAFIPRLGNRVVHRAFQYYVPVVLGIVCVFLLGHGREIIGIQSGVRLRLPMWMIHSEYFFRSDVWQILLGKGYVQLPEEARKFGIASLTEAHNNGIRMIVTFGVIGYLMYLVLLRDVAIRINSTVSSIALKFLPFACLIHVLLYSVTNEPAFYPGIFWPLTAWIFIVPEPTNNSFKE